MIEPVSNEAAAELLRKFGQKTESEKNTESKNGAAFDVSKYLQEHGVETVKVEQKEAGTYYCLKHCVFDPSHKNNDAAIIQAPSGMLLYKCFHDSCQGKTWKDARKIISGDDPLYGAAKAGGDPQPNSFKLVKYSDIAFRPADWVIDGLIERDSLVSLFGDPGCGKTFAALDAAACIATGKDFHGRTVQQGAVIYIAGEGQNGLKKRIMAWGIRHGVDIDSAPLFLSMMPAGICDQEQVDSVMDAVQGVTDAHGAPLLIVFDTVARNFGPGDENSTADMTRFIAGLDRIRARFHSCIMPVHHTGHADKTRSRGSSALFGAIDAEYILTKADGVIRLLNKKMKDHEPPIPMAFKLRTVELPLQDEYGRSVTSAVLDETEYQAPTPTPGATNKGAWQRISMDILRRLCQEHRDRLADGGYDPDQARVKLSDWQDACRDAGMSRETWRRIKDKLEQNPYVDIEPGDYVTPSEL